MTHSKQNIIQFPESDVIFYRKIESLIQSNQLSDAIALLLPKFCDSLDYRTIMYLSQCYIQLDDLESLRSLWHTVQTEYPTDYLTEPIQQIYIQSVPYILSIEQALLELYRLQSDFSQHNWSQHILDELIATLRQQNQWQHHIMSFLSQDNWIQNMTDYTQLPSFELLSQLKFFYTLKNNRLIPFLLALMADATVAQYIKSDILHYFIYQRLELNSILFDWYGTTLNLNTSQLVPYREMSSFQLLRDEIDIYCDDYIPHLQDELMHFLTLHYLTLYPQFDAVYANPQYWLALLLWQSGIEDTIDAALFSQEEIDTFTRVHQELFTLFN